MSDSLFCCTNGAKLLLVVLRIAIGWHLLYEGLYKLDTLSSGDPWTSQAYLENSTGPLSVMFRGLAGVTSAPSRPDNDTIVGRCKSRMERFDRFYRFDPDQKEIAAGELRFVKDQLEDQGQRDSQLDWVLQYLQPDSVLTEGSLTSSEKWRLATARQIWKDRIAEYSLRFDNQLYGILTPEQLAKGRVPATRSDVVVIDQLVIWGLILTGACLMLGLFSRSAAATAAAMLMLFYLAMPPLPGLASNTEGMSHFLFVNTKLIEAISLLVLATTYSGRWAGLDAVAAKLIARKVESRTAEMDS